LILLVTALMDIWANWLYYSLSLHGNFGMSSVFIVDYITYIPTQRSPVLLAIGH